MGMKVWFIRSLVKAQSIKEIYTSELLQQSIVFKKLGAMHLNECHFPSTATPDLV